MGTIDLKELKHELVFLKTYLSTDLNNPNAESVIEDALTIIESLNVEDFRFNIIRKIKELSDASEGYNMMTMYCLVATMNNLELYQFYQELLDKIKQK